MEVKDPNSRTLTFGLSFFLFWKNSFCFRTDYVHQLSLDSAFSQYIL